MQPDTRNLAMMIALGCSAVVAVASCSTHHSRYPPTWPSAAAQPQGTCEQVAGTYLDHGEKGSASVLPASLTDLLLGRESLEWKAEYVTLAFPQHGHMLVTLAGPDRASFSRVLTAEAGELECLAASVIVHRDAGWSSAAAGGGGAAVAGRESAVLELKSIDDYLILEREKRLFMLIGFIVPARSRTSEWYRFERRRAPVVEVARGEAPY